MDFDLAKSVFDDAPRGRTSSRTSRSGRRESGPTTRGTKETLREASREREGASANAAGPSKYQLARVKMSLKPIEEPSQPKKKVKAIGK